jgi:hypothetical protein
MGAFYLVGLSFTDNCNGNDNGKIPVSLADTPFCKRGIASHEIAGQARNDATCFA